MQLSDPKVAATQFTIYNSLSNLPVSFGAGLFATLGGTEEMTTVLWIAVALLFGGALLYGWMQAGSRHEPAPPVPNVDEPHEVTVRNEDVARYARASTS